VTSAPRQRMIVTAGTRPLLPRHARLRFDPARQMWLLLAPERVLTPDDIAVEVLQHCDGEATVAAIAAGLAQKYAAPEEQIAADVVAMLQDLADKGFLSAAQEVPT
jgi:pyrroloquinoline quinone biosynthesis protein D